MLCVARVQKFALAQILEISSLLSYLEMVYVHLEWFVYKDNDYLKNSQEHVYHSVHMYATIDYCNNNFKSLVMYPNWGTCCSN